MFREAVLFSPRRALCASSETTTSTTPKSEIDVLVEEASKSSKTVEETKAQTPGKDKTEIVEVKPPLWTRIKDEAKHYWFGTKLLWAELKIATGHLSRVLQGYTLTRRERNQLVRTSNDLLRLIPFSMFVLIPFMEFLLPVALAVFPGMLPSTYTTSKKRQETMKRKLRARVEMASFLQDVLEEAAEEIKTKSNEKDGLRATADDLITIVNKARDGHPMSDDSVLAISKLFRDDITLDTMSRPQLVTLCHFVGVTVFGTPSAVMRMQLRAHLRALKADDRMIMWEGIHMLNKQELQQACQDRGMRASGLSEYALRHQLQSWLNLSVRQDMPLAFLILSRAMTITASKDRLEMLGQTIAQMEEPVVKEAVRKSAVDASEDPELQLETLKHQSELIKEEKVSKDEVVMKPRTVKIVDPKEEEEEAHKLSLQELEALNVLASESAVEQERGEIQKLKEELEELTEELMEGEKSIPSDESARHVSSEGSPSSTLLDVPKGWTSKVEDQIANKLRGMLQQLEEEAKEVDEKIGDELFVIDRDKDGVMTVDELRDAVQNVLNTHNTDEEVDKVMQLLDADGDGNISKEELAYYAKKTREKAMVDDDEDEEEEGEDDDRRVGRSGSVHERRAA